ncbi:MAG: putative Nudix hydrolase NudL [Alphaproteobacteria bacterium MarineAlpha9_Bin7]|nr:MAG: putative Nudix hydrolase NudL [Alphaproteobacteria bacterium MarineAlpha9_Bin7]
MMRTRLVKNFANRRSKIEISAALSMESKTYFQKPVEDLAQAAVLVPIVDHADGLTVLLTQRGAFLKDHPGQISFPGGRSEETDDDSTATALRESEEAIGLNPNQVQILGNLDVCLTGTGFRVVPVVGLITPPLNLRLDTFEVADAFEIPFSLVLDAENYRRDHVVTDSGQHREFYVLDYGDHYIWGATARMLVNLRELMMN